MRRLVEALCSDACAGRAPGTPGGALARSLVLDALRDEGLDPFLQEVPRCRGANVLAEIRGDIDRWVMIAAHYDHLGAVGGRIYRGADDNAAAVAILVEVARRLAADPPEGRGVVLAAFDAEEPPYFLTRAMGSEHFARHPTLPLERIDLMVCMDLVGHALGGEELPSEVRDTVFALGAERSPGTRDVLIDTSEPGVFVRPADAEIIPPLSDYAAFWDRERPFLLLTNGRSRVYHTPDDVPAALAWDKMAATARWLERFVRATCRRDERPFRFVRAIDDLSTLESLLSVLGPLAEVSPQARVGLALARDLRAQVGRDRTIPSGRHAELAMLIAGLESGLA
ncbi:MAG: M28 family peptidase [Sandaracinaceae bacterium]|nr:M28 family peptidase [Sandaracinaceae bacterium]